MVLRLFQDALIGLTSALLAGVLRFDGPIPKNAIGEVVQFGIVYSLVLLVLQFFLHVYSNRYKSGGFEESIVMGFCSFFTVLIVYVLRIFFFFDNIPRSLSVLTGMICYIGLVTVRVIRRPIFKLFTSASSSGRHTLVYGAGQAGRQLVEEILRFEPNQNHYKVVGFLDDDKMKRNWRVLGFRVLGPLENLESVVRTTQAEILVVAISGLSYEKLSNLESRCNLIGIELRVIPSTFELITGSFKLSDLGDLTEENILGRRPVNADLKELADFVGGKRVLVTGAGGSIGSEIVRQIAQFGPEKLLKLDRDENALLNLQIGLVGNGLWFEQDLILADIRDSQRIREVFEEYKPQIVFHAAALKHLPILERFPDEAIKTNVQGTKNIIVASQKTGVEIFVNISTDKAADPVSILGQTKLITERLIAGIDLSGSDSKLSKFISVRFGNVIGSNGSFIHAFRDQISKGGPVTVTHPDVTRYFMTVSEAVHLVLQSVLIGSHGETLVLDMGEPVKIDSIARLMIRRSGKNIAVKYTGLRPGEKLHERLFTPQENSGMRKHQYILQCQVEPLKLDSV